MFDPARVRDRFSALRRSLFGLPVAYLDGAGGTQVPEPVIDAMAGVLRHGIGNLGGDFLTSREADEVTDQARSAVADLVNADGPEEIVFGQNMTSLTFATGRALARTWQEGDEIVVTRLDHDANIAPWISAADERGVRVRWVDFSPEEGCDLDYEGLEGLLGKRTRLVAVTHASNAVGTITDVARITRAAHTVDALVWIDAVHYAPHGPIDVRNLDCDFLVASAYKFFGPHTGVLYGKRRHLERLPAYKVRPAPERPPGKWETGTQSFESLAGVRAAVDYLASLGDGRETQTGPSRRAALVEAYRRIAEYERSLSARFLAAVEGLDRVTVAGRAHAGGRTPTFAVAVDGIPASEVERRLGAEGIFVWAGHYYAVEVMRRLGRLEEGGMVRIGFVHYNTQKELDRAVAALERVARGVA